MVDTKLRYAMSSPETLICSARGSSGLALREMSPFILTSPVAGAGVLNAGQPAGSVGAARAATVEAHDSAPMVFAMALMNIWFSRRLGDRPETRPPFRDERFSPLAQLGAFGLAHRPIRPRPGGVLPRLFRCV